MYQSLFQHYWLWGNSGYHYVLGSFIQCTIQIQEQLLILLYSIRLLNFIPLYVVVKWMFGEFSNLLLEVEGMTFWTVIPDSSAAPQTSISAILLPTTQVFLLSYLEMKKTSKQKLQSLNFKLIWAISSSWAITIYQCPSSVVSPHFVC